MVTMPSFARAALVAAGLSMAAAPDPAVAQADAEAFSRLPSQEIAGAQIGWFVNDTLGAFTNAVETNRPLIMVFGDATSSFTLAFAQYVAPCPHLNQLAGAATFAYGSPLIDESARRLAVHLKLTDYPTISVLAPRTDIVHEHYRLEGIFDAATAAGDLYMALTQNNYWPAGMPEPEPLPSHYLAYPNMACTPEGLERLGIGAQ
jgi:hypothetical protein